jgi:hypothetical protein
VGAADVDDDTRAPVEVSSKHRLAARGALAVAHGIGKR